ncbi:MAG: hypothetical protein WKF97_07235 [Chitinophagaceae bacterium]
MIVLEAGKDVTESGTEITELLEYKPGELFVKQFLRPIYVQPVDLTETLFITASLPGRMLEKCMAGESLLAQIVVDKYLDHRVL